jgi:hypothetical protein
VGALRLVLGQVKRSIATAVSAYLINEGTEGTATPARSAQSQLRPRLRQAERVRSANERIEAVPDLIPGGASVRPCCALLREMRGLRGSRSHMTPGHDQPGTVTGGEVAHPHSLLPNSLSRWSSAPLSPKPPCNLITATEFRQRCCRLVTVGKIRSGSRWR